MFFSMPKLINSSFDKVINEYFGLETGERKSLPEISKTLDNFNTKDVGVSKNMANVVFHRALRKLRQPNRVRMIIGYDKDFLPDVIRNKKCQ